MWRVHYCHGCEKAASQNTAQVHPELLLRYPYTSVSNSKTCNYVLNSTMTAHQLTLGLMKLYFHLASTDRRLQRMCVPL